MTRAAVTIVPAETDLLCEGCGYTLNGLPDTGNCPECGKPIEQSAGSDRVAPTWEDAGISGRTGALLATSLAVIVKPTHFFRTLATRRDVEPAFRFARLHWIGSSLLLGLAAGVHTTWYSRNYGTGAFRGLPDPVLWLALMIVIYLTLRLTTEIAARLTHWEATYRGFRLPLNVVRRGLYFHAAHYVPVGIMAAVTVVGYCVLVTSGVLGGQSTIYYLYVLCAEVILAAAYLFWTYWIGMKNMMFANR